MRASTNTCPLRIAGPPTNGLRLRIIPPYLAQCSGHHHWYLLNGESGYMNGNGDASGWLLVPPSRSVARRQHERNTRSPPGEAMAESGGKC